MNNKQIEILKSITKKFNATDGFMSADVSFSILPTKTELQTISTDLIPGYKWVAMHCDTCIMHDPKRPYHIAIVTSDSELGRLE